MAIVEYKWHAHPLHLRSILSNPSSLCFVCNLPVSGYNYSCPTTCNFFLHISCLKLPLESLHPLHHHHPPLSLSPTSLSSKPTCSDCKSPSSGLTYHCPSCPFSLHLHCATKTRTFNFETHKHALTFSPSPPSGYQSFRCYVCGELGFGFSLSCKNGGGCSQFVVHVECSVLPVTVKRERDNYPFALVTARSVDDEPEELYCDVCEKTVNPNGCIYYCGERNYISHLGCLISAKKPHFKSAYKDFDPKIESHESKSYDPSSSVPKIEPHESTSYDQSHYQDHGDDLSELMVKFSKNQIGEKLQHFSHPHGLILTDVFQKKNMICYACWGRFTGTAYVCHDHECSFALHKWCANLPKEIQHPIHPQHSLTFPKTPKFDSVCDACYLPCDGFIYHCNSCTFNLHFICASIPTILINEIHHHPLHLRRKTPYSTNCNACGEDCTAIVFDCEPCGLNLDFRCALLPHKIRHKCHVDPLVLNHVGVEEDDDSEEFLCDACEKERDPKHWVYHCGDCEYSAHMNCVVSKLIGGPPSRGLVGFDHHDHILGLITRSTASSS